MIISQVPVYVPTVETDGHMVSGGYLYIVRSKKKVLQKPKDGFNKFIELNNIIPHVGLHDHLPPSTLQGFSEAIKRGYHIINADLRFTSDNMPVICDDDMLEKISNGITKFFANLKVIMKTN